MGIRGFKSELAACRHGIACVYGEVWSAKL